MDKKDFDEKSLLWSFFDNKNHGYFVEVGAGDPFDLSISYDFEKEGWDGILIEPQSKLAEKLKASRKAKVWQVACGSPEDTGEAELYLCGEFSSLKKHTAFTDLVYSESEKVQVVTLDYIIEKEGFPEIDLLSIDVEGLELEVLRGIDFEKTRPRLIFLEYHVLSLDIHFFLLKKGYKLIKRTGVNNWYVPKETKYQTKALDRLKLVRKMYLGTPLRKAQFTLKKHTKHRKYRTNQ